MTRLKISQGLMVKQTVRLNLKHYFVKLSQLMLNNRMNQDLLMTDYFIEDR
jgi:hypothetical protein